MLFGFLSAGYAAVCSVTLPPAGDVAQAVINASDGDVICLSAGVYPIESYIPINKAITIQGPQSGVDPRPRAPPPASC